MNLTECRVQVVKPYHGDLEGCSHILSSLLPSHQWWCSYIPTVTEGFVFKRSKYTFWRALLLFQVHQLGVNQSSTEMSHFSYHTRKTPQFKNKSFAHDNSKYPPLELYIVLVLIYNSRIVIEYLELKLKKNYREHDIFIFASNFCFQKDCNKIWKRILLNYENEKNSSDFLWTRANANFSKKKIPA